MNLDRSPLLLTVQAESDIIGIKIFGTSIIVVNSLEVALELCDGKPWIYSDRSALIVSTS